MTAFKEGIVLQSAVVAPANGVSTVINDMKQINLEVTGTATAFEVVIECLLCNTSTTYYPVSVMNLGTLSMSSSLVSFALYSGDVSAFYKVRARVASVSGGYVTVTANFTK